MATATEIRAEISKRSGSSRSASPSTARRGWLFLKLVIASGIVAWLLASGRLDLSLLSSFEGGFSFLAVVFAFQVGATLLQILRWWILVRTLGMPIPWREALHVSLVGCGANLFAPGGLGLEGARLLHFRRHDPKRLPALVSTLIADRMLGLLAAIALASASSLFLLRTSFSESATTLLIGSVALLALLAGAFAYLIGWLPIGMPRWITGRARVRELLDSLARFRCRRLSLAVCFAMSIVSQMCLALAAWSALGGLGVERTITPVLTATPIIVLSSVIPLAPAGLGIAEGVAAELYPALGLSGGAETQLVLRATFTVILAACGLAYFRSRASWARVNNAPTGAASEEIER